MALPWVRLDSSIATHEKILGLLDERPESLAFRGAFSYICSIGYSGAHGTDGLIPFNALPFVHGTKKTAELLVKHHLWEPDRLGWRIRNFEVRQQTAAVSKSIQNSRRAAAAKGNCVRWHGPNCSCWREEGVA